MREVVFTMIAGNPYIKIENKPETKEQVLKLSIDKEKKEKTKAVKTLSPEEVEKEVQWLRERMNANPIK